MPNLNPADLVRLLVEPSESLSVEHKDWLDLSQSAARANLAKAAIALANEGGGIIVLGTRDKVASGRSLTSVPRPSTLSMYTTDEVNNTISKFADPAFHCELQFAVHPESKVEHAFVLVPGGMTVPVMSCRGSDGAISAQKCYIRKPGPRSEEPFTADEWRGVFERCLQARRETMLEAIRTIVSGRVDAPAAPAVPAAALQAFRASSYSRWQSLVKSLPKGDPGKFPHGHYEVFFKILDVPAAKSLSELKERVSRAGHPRLTGWGPFIDLGRDPYLPRAVNGGVETWLGATEENRRTREPHHCDYWRAEPEGQFFLMRGFDEDSISSVKPGTAMDVTLPAWRIGELLYFAARIARLFGPEARVVAGVRYEGLRGRTLVSIDSMRLMRGNWICADDDFEFTLEATPQQIDDSLAELLAPGLQSFYERFSFFQPPPSLVGQELEKLRKGRF